MQTLARASYTDAQITALLTTDVLGVSAGIELLAPDLTLVADISGDLVDGSITHVSDADAQHGTLTMNLSRKLTWGTALVRPYMVLSDAAVIARFNCGVFYLTTPETLLGSPVTTYRVDGYDRLYALNRSVGDSYHATAGTVVLTAVVAAVVAAGLPASTVLLDGTSIAKTLPADMVWPLMRAERDAKGRFLPGHDTDYAWLDIINDLLGLIGYSDLWVDENGYFRSEPDVDPSLRPVGFTFTVDSADTIVGQDRTLIEDLWQVPNRWVFIQSNRDSSAPAPTIGNGIYQVDNVSTGPASQNGRGMVWPKVTQVDAADQATLVAQGDAQVAEDMRVSTTLKVTTGPFPAAGHRDVYLYTDSSLDPATGLTRKVSSLTWTLDLLGADMTHEWAVLP